MKRIRLSGNLKERPNAADCADFFFFAVDENKVYVSDGAKWSVRGPLKFSDAEGILSGPEASRPPAVKNVGYVYHATNTGKFFEAFPSENSYSAEARVYPLTDLKIGDMGWFRVTMQTTEYSGGRPAPDASAPSVVAAKLRSSLSNQFGALLKSTGDNAIVGPVTFVIMQTLDASPEKPLLVKFDQIILEAFTGSGQFDLVEHDSSDDVVIDDENNVVHGGESRITLATKDGFEDGDTVGAWSRFAKVITSDKVYSIVGVPGDAGAGAFSLSVQPLMEVK